MRLEVSGEKVLVNSCDTLLGQKEGGVASWPQNMTKAWRQAQPMNTVDLIRIMMLKILGMICYRSAARELIGTQGSDHDGRKRG